MGEDYRAIIGAAYGPFVIAVLLGLFGALLAVALGISVLLILINVVQFILLIVLGARIIKHTPYGLAYAAAAGALAGITIGSVNVIAFWFIYVPLRGTIYTFAGLMLNLVFELFINFALWLFVGIVAAVIGGLAGRHGMELIKQAEEKEAKRKAEAAEPSTPKAGK
jgi:hypothetical protein